MAANKLDMALDDIIKSEKKTGTGPSGGAGGRGARRGGARGARGARGSAVVAARTRRAYNAQKVQRRQTAIGVARGRGRGARRQVGRGGRGFSRVGRGGRNLNIGGISLRRAIGGGRGRGGGFAFRSVQRPRQNVYVQQRANTLVKRALMAQRRRQLFNNMRRQSTGGLGMLQRLTANRRLTQSFSRTPRGMRRGGRGGGLSLTLASRLSGRGAASLRRGGPRRFNLPLGGRGGIQRGPLPVNARGNAKGRGTVMGGNLHMDIELANQTGRVARQLAAADRRADATQRRLMELRQENRLQQNIIRNQQTLIAAASLAANASAGPSNAPRRQQNINVGGGRGVRQLALAARQQRGQGLRRRQPQQQVVVVPANAGGMYADALMGAMGATRGQIARAFGGGGGRQRRRQFNLGPQNFSSGSVGARSSLNERFGGGGRNSKIQVAQAQRQFYF